METSHIILGIVFVIILVAKFAPFNNALGQVSYPNFTLVGPGNGCPSLAAPGKSADIAKLCASTVSCTGMLVDGQKQAIACSEEVSEGAVTDKSLVTVVDNLKHWLNKYVYYRKGQRVKRYATGHGPLGILSGYTYKGQKKVCNIVDISGDHEQCQLDTRCKGIGVRQDGTAVFCGDAPNEKGSMHFYQLKNPFTN